MIYNITLSMLMPLYVTMMGPAIAIWERTLNALV